MVMSLLLQKGILKKKMISYFECQCQTPEHTLRIYVDKEYEECIFTIFLNNDSFLKRLKNAFFYIWVYPRESLVFEVLNKMLRLIYIMAICQLEINLACCPWGY